MNFDTTTHQNIQIDCDVIATEAFSIRPQMLSRARDRLMASLVDIVNTARNWDYSRPEALNVSQMRSATGRLTYIDEANELFPVPVGFKRILFVNSMETYATELASAFDELGKLKEQLFPQALSLLSKYVNDRERLQEPVDKDILKWFETMACAVPGEIYSPSTKVAAPLNRFFGSERHSILPLQNIYGNFNSVVKTADIVQGLNKVRFERLNQRAIAREVGQLEVMSKRLLMDMERDKPTQNNTQMVMAVVKSVADWTFTYATVTTLALNLTSAMKNTEKQLLRS